LHEALLKKTAQLVYVVRSNIAHSEKTSKGPDLSKTKRDKDISEVTAAVIENCFDFLLAESSQRLAVYSSLAPGQPNAVLLQKIDGIWREGKVRGTLSEHCSLKVFSWHQDGLPVPVQILESASLNNEYEGLDKFEGKRYCRILVPVDLEKKIWICNIYAGGE